MKICVVAITGSWGGMEVHTVTLSRELKAKCHDVKIIEIGEGIYSQRGVWAIEGIPVIVVKKRVKYQLGLSELLRLIPHLEGEIFILPKGSIDTGNWVIDFIARLFFKKYISIEHLECQPMPMKERGRYLLGLLPGLGIWWYRLYLQRRARAIGPNLILCVSDAVRRSLAELYSFPPRKLITIRNGIDIDKFKPSDEKRCFIRTEWGLPESTLVFGSIGRFSQEKGYYETIMLFKDLTKSMPGRDMRYIIVGEGHSREKLEGLINELNLNDKVFLFGFSDQPWNIYPGFDVFLMLSKIEGLPLTLLEAMASGCVPIAMGVSGIPEVITNKELGWLVQPDDNQGFLAAMKNAANISRSTLDEMGQKARKHIVSYFDAKTQYSKILNLITSSTMKSPNLLNVINKNR